MSGTRTQGRRLSLAVKLGIPIVAISIATSALLGFLNARSARDRVDVTYRAEAADIAELLRERFPSFPDDPSEINAYLGELAQARPSLQRVQLIRTGSVGNPFVWASSLPSDIPLDFDRALLPESGGTHSQEVILRDDPAFMVSDDVGLPNVAAAVTYFSLEPRERAIEAATRTVAVQSLLVLALQLVGLAIASYLVVLKRLKRMGTAAEAVAGGDFSQRLPEGAEPPGRDELVNVAREFDHMVQAVASRTAELEAAAGRERDDAERLRELDRIKNLLLHAVSHDLRSPITSVMGSAKTLERADDLNLSDEDRLMLIRGLSASARKMSRLVEDILDVERLERGIVTPKRRPTDVGALVTITARDAAADDSHPVQIEAPPLVMNVDAAEVERIVDNLVRNAMKHTPRGTTVRVSVMAEDGGAHLIVEDEGPGVPDEVKDRIFEAFRQGDPEARTPGVGVGLSLVSRFAELHGGRAWVTDRPGGGAAFHVVLADGEPDPDDDDDEPAENA